MEFQETGAQIVAHYFNSLTTNRQALASMYSDTSMLTYENEQFMGSEQIMTKLNSLPNLTYDSASAVADYQPSVNESILAMVSGRLFIDGNKDQPLTFTQTFVLCPGG